MLSDLRYAIRTLSQSPLFALTAIGSLALGIGANTAIFSLSNAMLWKPLPVVERPEELRLIEEPNGNTSLTYPLWEALRDRQKVFDAVFAWSSTRFNLAEGGEVDYADGAFVSGDYFRGLGLHPAVGRLFDTRDDTRGRPNGAVAVLGYDFWQRRYQGDPGVVGKTLRVEGETYQIVGVMPAGFFGMFVGTKIDVALPFSCEPLVRREGTSLDRRTNWWLTTAGRSAAPVGEINGKLDALSPEILAMALDPRASQEGRDSFLRRRFTTSSAAQGIAFFRKQYRTAMQLLLATVGVVLLIACANIANLLLARGAARQREIAVRLAMGASRGRLVRQLLTEGLLLALAGALVGLLLARPGAQLLVQGFAPSARAYFDLSMDWRVGLFTVALALGTAVLFGLAPAWRATRVEITESLKQNARSATGTHFRFGKALVAVQVALSVLLLAGAIVFVQSLRNLLQTDMGFAREGILLARVDMRRSGYTPERRVDAWQELADRIRAIPGVAAATYSDVTPISSSVWQNTVTVPGFTPAGPQDDAAHYNAIAPGYFAVFQTPILQGREYVAQDRGPKPRQVIVNEAFVRHFFGGANAVGRTVFLGRGKDADGMEVIGVVKDAKYENLRENVPPTIYRNAEQATEANTSRTFAIRFHGAGSRGVATGIRDAVRAQHTALAVEFRGFSEQVEASLQRDKLLAWLTGAFSGLGVLLAVIGLYGVLSYVVARRQGEIGIRMALGATPVAVVLMVLREIGVWVAGGLFVGLVAAAWAAGMAESLVFGVKADDPAVIGLAVASLLGVSLLAALAPARRAASVDPAVALREE